MSIFVLSVESIARRIRESNSAVSSDANVAVTEFFRLNPGLSVVSCGWNSDGSLRNVVVEGEQTSTLRW